MSDDPKLTPMACPDCHLMSFTAWIDPRAKTITVKCEGCDRVLLTSTPID